jgi:selenocysteine-specific elongation factor
VLEAAEAYFRENPKRLFLDKLKLRQTVGLEEVFFQELLRSLSSRGVLQEQPGNRLRFRDFGPRLLPEEVEVRERVIEALKAAPFATPAPAELAVRLGKPPGSVEEILALLDEEGEVLRLAEDVFLHREAVEEARRRLKDHLERHRTMTAADARNVLESSRRYVIPLLEHFDREGLTLRRGDLRELRSTT